MSRIACLALLAAIGLAPFPVQAEPTEQIGRVSFANSCSADVQPQLLRAVALLHSFWWREGEAAFRDVLAQDSACTIATWGLATVLLGNPFSTGPTPQQAQRAADAIARGRSTPPRTDRERGYIDAIAAYYDGFAERRHPVRLRALADAFGALSSRFPDDDETQIFSALYLVATQSPNDNTFARAMQGAIILQSQFARTPAHPGVAHYLIHSFDFPPIAEGGLPAAICYADIAPSAPHALHMPSHIFTRVGLWSKSAASNRRAADTARTGGDRADQLHALDYLVYADLQLARDRDAGTALEETSTVAEDGLAAAYARSAIPARYAIERGMWRDAAALPAPEASKFPFAGAIRIFARALGAARSGNPSAARQDAAQLRLIGAALETAHDDYWAGEVEVQRLGADAWIAYAEGRREEGLATMRVAADLEDASEKAAVSPGRLIPARELLGDMLFESGEPAAALSEYEKSQTRDPQRFRGLSGAAQAARRAGDDAKARAYFGRLVEMASGGDRAELSEATDFLARR